MTDQLSTPPAQIRELDVAALDGVVGSGILSDIWHDIVGDFKKLVAFLEDHPLHIHVRR